MQADPFSLHVFYQIKSIHMRLLYILSLIFFVCQLQAQTLSVKYNCLYDGSIYQNQLSANDTLSYWEGIADAETADPAAELLIKRIRKNRLEFIDYIFQKKFYVFDSLHPMQWVFGEEEKTLLDYSCKAAYTQFRGRKYMAYYTTALPASIGPWKFGGLPGTILEVVSDDRQYQFLATAVDTNHSAEFTDDAFQSDEFISWQAYCRLFIETADHYARYMQTVNNSPGATSFIRIGRPEIIYPKAQAGIGIGAE
jgi:GLPGLI family protein